MSDQPAAARKGRTSDEASLGQRESQVGSDAKRTKVFWESSRPYFCDALTLKATLERYGVAVIPNVLDASEVASMQAGAWSSLETLCAATEPPLKRDEPSTWNSFQQLLPMHSMLLQHFGIGHAPFVWELRQNPKIAQLFADLWKCRKEDLLTSFDGASFHFPPEETGQGFFRQAWFHTDQSPQRSKFECAQSWVTAYDVRPGDATLSVLVGSHLHHKNLTSTEIGVDVSKLGDKGRSDWCQLTPSQVQYFKETLHCEEHHITCPAGSMVFFDSRVQHCGREAVRGRGTPNFRCVVYLCMLPRSAIEFDKLAKCLEKRRTAFEARRMTNHWPSRFKMFPKLPRTWGKALPVIAPLPAPTLTALGRKLVGF